MDQYVIRKDKTVKIKNRNNHGLNARKVQQPSKLIRKSTKRNFNQTLSHAQKRRENKRIRNRK